MTWRVWCGYVWNDIESFSRHCFLETIAPQSRPYLEWKPTTVTEEEMIPRKNRKVKFYFSLTTKNPFLLCKLPLAVHDENLRKSSGSWRGEGSVAFNKWCKLNWLTMQISFWVYLLFPLAPELHSPRRGEAHRALAEEKKH